MVDAYTNTEELMDWQHRPPSSREDMNEALDISGAKESLASSGPDDVKAEGNPLQEKKNSLIPANIKAKYGTAVVEKLISEEQVEEIVFLLFPEG